MSGGESGNDYRVVGADWALGPTGGPAGDVVALEHVREDGLCLVCSTTLGLTFTELAECIAEHERSCTK